MRIATLMGIAVLGMSGAAIASVGTTPQTTAPSAQDNSAMPDNGTATSNTMAPDSTATPDTSTTAPDNSMTPPTTGGTTTPDDSTGDSSGG